jgi:uncharacterized protein
MSGGILSSCLSNSIPSKAILIDSVTGIPDPEGAAILIESLGKITDNTSLKVDTAELRKQGAALKTRMEKIIQSLAEQQQQGQDEQAQSTTSVRDGVMYG